ncbi:MAG: flagellar basal-body rod modification protein FlgD [Myxococcota bacterium]|jgi:flagellar basal-body rod modification protein FlgD
MDPITGPSSSLFASQAPATPAAGDNELGQDAFLNLLTTQLQNQDPANPMSNEDFIAQLAQFTSVEQLMGMRELMQEQTFGIAALNSSSMANLLGTEVTAASDRFSYSGEGDHALHFEASSAASSVTVRVMDETGNVVDTIEVGSVSAGEGTVNWDGLGIDGNRLPEGEYSFAVTGTDGDGNDVFIQEYLVGVVDEMDYTSGNPRPSVNGIPVNLGDILRLQTGAEN